MDEPRLKEFGAGAGLTALGALLLWWAFDLGSEAARAQDESQLGRFLAQFSAHLLVLGVWLLGRGLGLFADGKGDASDHLDLDIDLGDSGDGGDGGGD